MSRRLVRSCSASFQLRFPPDGENEDPSETERESRAHVRWPMNTEIDAGKSDSSDQND